MRPYFFLVFALAAAASAARLVQVCAGDGYDVHTAFVDLANLTAADCRGACPCADCTVGPALAWAPCADADEPACVAAPCEVLDPVNPVAGCAGLACEACALHPNCTFCLDDRVCSDTAANATCAAAAATPERCFVPPSPRIVPLATCVRPGGAVLWGYVSTFDSPRALPFGDGGNAIDANVTGVSAVFEPGVHPWHFETAGDATWALMFDVASSAGAPACPDCEATSCGECAALPGCAWAGGACASSAAPAVCPVYGSCPYYDACLPCAAAGCVWCGSAAMCVSAGITCANAASEALECTGDALFVSEAAMEALAHELRYESTTPDSLLVAAAIAVFSVIVMPLTLVFLWAFMPRGGRRRRAKR